MKPSEKGYILVELLVATTIMVLASGAAGAAIFQIFRGTEHNNDHMTVVRQVQNAGYWISRDAQMAQSVTTDDLTLPDFLVISWTEDVVGDPIYHTATYYFEDLTDGLGKLKRNHVSTAGADEDTLVAQYIYYDPSDVDNTSKANHEGAVSPVLTVQLTAIFKKALETREYKITHRANL
ncbi:type II secretion system protein J [Chloroflexota bacterium]